MAEAKAARAHRLVRLSFSDGVIRTSLNHRPAAPLFWNMHQRKGFSAMRSLLIASTILMALGAAPAMAKPTVTEIAWNMRAVLAPQVDLGTRHQALRPRLQPAPDVPDTAYRDNRRAAARPLS
jgi:hypothetical protein